jgi:hypothetical protein
MKYKPSFLTVLALYQFTGAANAQTILLSDNFNTEYGGFAQLNYNNFINWNVNGNVDLIGNGNNDFLPGNGLYVDMNGTPGPGELVSKQDFSLLPGITYTLAFDLAGSQRGFEDTVDVSIGNAYSSSFSLASSTPFVLETIPITVATPTSVNLSFQSLAGDNADIGLLLDNVSLVQNSPNGTPEPGAIGLLIGVIIARATIASRLHLHRRI